MLSIRSMECRQFCAEYMIIAVIAVNIAATTIDIHIMVCFYYSLSIDLHNNIKLMTAAQCATKHRKATEKIEILLQYYLQANWIRINCTHTYITPLLWHKIIHSIELFRNFAIESHDGCHHRHLYIPFPLIFKDKFHLFINSTSTKCVESVIATSVTSNKCGFCVIWWNILNQHINGNEKEEEFMTKM